MFRRNASPNISLLILQKFSDLNSYHFLFPPHFPVIVIVIVKKNQVWLLMLSWQNLALANSQPLFIHTAAIRLMHYTVCLSPASKMLQRERARATKLDSCNILTVMQCITIISSDQNCVRFSYVLLVYGCFNIPLTTISTTHTMHYFLNSRSLKKFTDISKSVYLTLNTIQLHSQRS